MTLSSCNLIKAHLPVTFSCNVWSRQPRCHLLPHRSGKHNLQQRMVLCQGFMDQLADYINGGPKLRKWYGEGDLPIDGGSAVVRNMPEPEDIAPEDIVRDAVLVTDADSPTGEQVVLQLILGRLPVKIITQDAEEAKRGYGPYVTAFAGDVGDDTVVKRAMRGARAVICPGKLGAVLGVAAQQKVEHIVLLSSAEIDQPRGLNLGALFGTEQALLKDPKRELAVQQSGIPFTIVRAGKIKSQPGSMMQLEISQNDQASGDISREDVARVLAGALQAPPDHGLVFQVTASGPGRPPEDWVSVLSQLSTTSVS